MARLLFRKDETLNAILYVLKMTNGCCDMHKLCKILYFADQKHLSLYGRSITGDEYIAMNYGPVPSCVYDIFKAVRGDSYFCGDEFKDIIYFPNKKDVAAKAEPDMDYLSQSDVECLDYAIEICRDKSFTELTNMSHGYAWNNTMRDRNISVKDILREAGDDEGYAEYIARCIEEQKAFSL